MGRIFWSTNQRIKKYSRGQSAFQRSVKHRVKGNNTNDNVNIKYSNLDDHKPIDQQIKEQNNIHEDKHIPIIS